MCYTCDNVTHMSKMIQIRNVPDEVHTELKVRAARAGMSLSDYLLKEMERVVATPSVEEYVLRMSTRERHRWSESPAEMIRAERDSR